MLMQVAVPSAGTLMQVNADNRGVCPELNCNIIVKLNMFNEQ